MARLISGSWHWRDSAREVRFLFFDARAGIILFFTLLHIRYWTLGVCTLIVLGFFLLERFGLTFPAALRKLRVFLIGNKRPAWVKMSRRPFHDYGI